MWSSLSFERPGVKRTNALRFSFFRNSYFEVWVHVRILVWMVLEINLGSQIGYISMSTFKLRWKVDKGRRGEFDVAATLQELASGEG